MNIPEWLFLTVSITLFLVIGSLLLVSSFSFLQFSEQQKAIGLLQEDIILAIAKSPPTLSELLLIASTRDVKRSDLYKLLKDSLRESLTGRHAVLSEHADSLKQYIAQMESAEPFEGLPDEIRLHLNRLREKLPTEKGLLEPLTNQIRELVSLNEKDKKAQRRYSSWGFVVGVIGLIFAGYAYFYPQTSVTPQNTETRATPTITGNSP